MTDRQIITNLLQSLTDRLLVSSPEFAAAQAIDHRENARTGAADGGLTYAGTVQPS